MAACVAAVELANVEVVICDGRELLRERPEVAGATGPRLVRAVGRLDEAVGMASAWLAPGGRLAHWKGRALSAPGVRAGERPRVVPVCTSCPR